jgi:hypothetical protein
MDSKTKRRSKLNKADIDDIDLDDVDKADLKDAKNKKPNELAEMIIAPFTVISFKSCILLFIIFLFVSSNVFIDQFLSGFENVLSDGQLTNKGIVIQGTFLVLFYILSQIILEFDLI